jgi:hypothetical protein
MANCVHFWSNEPGDWIHASSQHDAEKHSEHDAQGEHGGVTQLTSLVQMHSVFRAVLGNNYAFDVADFHTHGGAGFVGIGNEYFTWGAPLDPFENQGFEKIFKPNAAIIFTGCNVGDGASGEYFLTEIGRIFLKSGGGTVRGNTGAGIAEPVFTGNVYHPTGRWVTATVTPGGAVSLSGHTNLIRSVITERIGKLEMLIKELEGRTTPANLKPGRDGLSRAADYVTPPADGSWRNLCYANLILDEAEEKLIAEQTRIIYGHKFGPLA